VFVQPHARSEPLRKTVMVLVIVIPFLLTLYAIYIRHWMTQIDAFVFWIMYIITGLGVTVGYHRMVTHGSFEAKPFVRFIILAYGTTTSETDTSPRVTSHSVTINSLSSSTTYHFRLNSTDASTNNGQSSDQTFVTSAAPDTTSPVISSVVVTPSSTSVVITWTTDEIASSIVDYGATSSYGTTTSEIDTSPRVILR
jgi:hypothetical protein